MKINVLSKLLILSAMALLLSACGQAPLTGEYGSANAVSSTPTPNAGFVCNAQGPSGNVVNTGTPVTIQFTCNSPFTIAVSGSGSPTIGTQTPTSNGGVSFPVTFGTAGVQTITVLATQVSNSASNNAQSLVFSVQGTSTSTTPTASQPLVCSAAASSNMVTIATSKNGTVNSATTASSPFTLTITTNRNATLTSLTPDGGISFAEGSLPTTPGTTLTVSGNTFAGRAGLFNVKATVTDATSGQTASCSAAVAVTTPSATSLQCTASAGTSTVTTPVDANGVPTGASSNVTYTVNCSNGSHPLTVTAAAGPQGSTMSGVPGVNGNVITLTANVGPSVGSQPYAITITDKNGNTTTVAAVVTANAQAPATK